MDFPDKADEEKHYKTQWETTDPDFWKSQVDVLLQLINNYRTPKHILDFGSGSGEMTREFLKRGYAITPLEPMIHGYLEDQNYPARFDVVIAVEVLEHLLDPWHEIREIEKVLAPRGIVIFSTLLTNEFIHRPDAADHFKSWWYKDDPTHVSFFCNHVLSKMADIGNYDIDIIGDKVFVLQRIP
ncbi:MAG: methyltransferase [Nitrospinaceae bacterium]|nr:MAG: methyltransferase [Nitrospinaceae bacterium]